MKTLVISYMYPNKKNPNLGIFIKERLINLSQLCDVKLVNPYPWVPPFGFFKKITMPHIQTQDNVEIYRPKYFPLPGSFFNFIKGIWCFIFIKGEIKRINRKFNFDIIHAHRVFPEGFASILLGRIYKKPVVITVHGSDINSLSKNILIRRMILFTLNKADKIIAVSEALKKRMVEIGTVGKKINVLFNGVDLNKFKVQSKVEARKKLSLPQKREIVLFVGNLVKVKNPLLLIEAMRRLKENGNNDCLLIMIGGGFLKREIENRISKYSLGEIVIITGAKLHEELPIWMAAADCLVLPSKNEGMGVVLLEAMACGLPIVATKVGGIPEIIKDGERGILVEPNDIAGTIKGILTLVDSENLREKFIINGQRFIREKKLTWQEQAHRVFDIYKEVLHSRN